mgnify:CR=1 FL=1
MSEPIKYKVMRLIYGIVRRMTGHNYACCNHLFKRCSKCKYVTGENYE